jgi:hypothetical protein
VLPAIIRRIRGPERPPSRPARDGAIVIKGRIAASCDRNVRFQIVACAETPENHQSSTQEKAAFAGQF